VVDVREEARVPSCLSEAGRFRGLLNLGSGTPRLCGRYRLHFGFVQLALRRGGYDSPFLNKRIVLIVKGMKRLLRKPTVPRLPF
jgi:hypothetical protein